jgi:hypothetical protein
MSQDIMSMVSQESQTQRTRAPRTRQQLMKMQNGLIMEEQEDDQDQSEDEAAPNEAHDIDAIRRVMKKKKRKITLLSHYQQQLKK